jgi:hypothetical protein
MIDEYVHTWDRPKPDHDPAHPSVVTTPKQALSGLHIGLANLQALCTTCGDALGEGQPIWVYAYRAAEDPEWLLTRCYCRDCAPDGIETPTLGTSETLIEAYLDVVSLSGERRHQLCLSEVAVLAFSPLTKGAAP